MQRILAVLFTVIWLPLPCAALSLSVEAPDELWPTWERIAASHPLPSGVVVNRAQPGALRADDRLIVRLGPGPGRKAAERIVLAPVGRLGETRGSVRLSDVRSGAIRTAPLESITLPDIALAVDGLYPDDPGYPLQSEAAIGIESDNPGLRGWYDSLPKPEAGAARPEMIWIGAVGDIMPARGVDKAMLADGGLQHVFGDMLPILRSCSLLLGNLEAAATSAGTRATKTYTFRFDGAALGSLRSAGFSYLSVANNHAFDFGQRGFLDTLASLSQWDIGTSCAGASEREASLPLVVQTGSMEVRVLSFGAYPVDRTGFDGRKAARASGDRPGTLWCDAAGLSTASRAFSPGSFNIALVHGGQEWSSIPSAEQVRLYRELVRAGADLVVGSHPHVLQGMEVLNGRLIAYSLGNFLFPGMEGTEGGEDSVLLKLGIVDGKVRCVRAIPLRLHGGAVRLAEGEAVLRTFEKLTRALDRDTWRK